MQRSASYSSAHLREHKQSSQPFRQPTMLRCGQELRLRMASVYLQVVGVSLMCICDKVSSERSSWDGDQLTLQSAIHLYMLALALYCGILLTHQYAPNDIRSQALRECTDSFLSSNSDQSAHSVWVQIPLTWSFYSVRTHTDQHNLLSVSICITVLEWCLCTSVGFPSIPASPPATPAHTIVDPVFNFFPDLCWTCRARTSYKANRAVE